MPHPNFRWPNSG